MINRTRGRFVRYAIGVLASTVASNTFAAGHLEFEGWSFYQSSNDRATNTANFIIGPDIEEHGRYINGKLDLRAYTITTDRTAFTLEAQNAFISSNERLSQLHQISAGRRQYDWSRMDDEWTLGLWSPRFSWDPLRPIQVGLTGAFYTYQSKHWRFLAYGSPLSIPERGFPQSDGGGKITSPSPWFNPLPEKVQVQSQTLPIAYKINYPPIETIILRPAVGTKLSYDSKEGYWASAGYGYMPIHQVDLAVDAKVNIQDNRVNAVVYPRFPMHHLLTTEAGYDYSWWGIWGSLTGEYPEQPPTPSDFRYTPIGPSLVTSWGGNIKMREGLSLKTSYLTIRETKTALPSSAGTIDTPGRYPYTKAWMLGGDWQPTDLLTYTVKWTYDVAKVSSLLSMDLMFKKPTPSGFWGVGIGSDFINSDTNKGLIGQYEGNDRVRGKVVYAF